ncbi:ABC transporter permease [Rarobacter incanus]|uniref:ABC transporter permease n=1 Tax=Rarobacter incanus TaxID=153494 RepID=UPI001FEB3825|nr:ABC transporter permease [Rarobacter incanus]
MTPQEPVDPQVTEQELAELAESQNVDIALKEVEGLSQGQIVVRRFFRHKGAVAALIIFFLIVLLAFTSVGIGSWTGWWKHTPLETGSVAETGGNPTLRLPTWLGGEGFVWGDYPFGRDESGRDVFARVMRGTQTSLIVMFVVGIVSSLIGVVVGALAGFYRGKLDAILMRMTDLVITIPVIVLGAVLGALASNKSSALMLAVFLGLVSWTTLARLVRGDFLTLREREFVDAARVAGASDLRIMFKHMLPNSVGVIIVNQTLLMSSAILLETSLSFIGLGIKYPNISLGQLINQYQEAFATRPWLFWWPGLFIVLIALCINFIGDGLRDAFDPRQRRIPSARKMEKAARKQSATPAAIVAATAAESGNR